MVRVVNYKLINLYPMNEWNDLMVVKGSTDIFK